LQVSDITASYLPPEQGTITFNEQLLPAELKQRSREELRQLQMIYQMADVAMNPRHTVSTIIGRPGNNASPSCLTP